MPMHPWWRDAVIYQVYPRSWADSDGDGVGDLPGITSRLEHLVDLGVDALWLSPFYVSPQHDGGYDVADFRDVDPLFGTLADFDALVSRAHTLGLRVIVDVVPNHTSEEHPWFRAALESGPGSRERARYVFREGRGPDGEDPPNNWVSKFGGPAWTRLPDEHRAGAAGPGRRPTQWYLHLFDSTQPDLDWTNPEVQEELESVLRFWLDRGVDGFRIDVAHGLVKAEGLPDADLSIDADVEATGRLPMWDQPGVHEIYRRWRRLTDSWVDTHSSPLWGEDGDRVLCGEAWVQPAEALARYVRPDELHQTFNFAFLMCPWRADDLRSVITTSLASAKSVGAPQTWVLSNHDVVRHATRLAYPQDPGQPPVEGIGADDPQPDPALGLRRARAATALMLALPGSAYLYQGEELGLPEATRIPDDARQDPTWERSGHTRRGRDGCRVPVPWSAEGPSLGFGPEGLPWLPQPSEYATLSPDQQRGDTGSTLELYRRLLRLRRELRLGRGHLEWAAGFPDSAVAFTVSCEHGSVLVVANLGAAAVALPSGAQVLLSSDDLDDGRVPSDVTAWALLG
ncbi:glycoside hydrolase family 13 protein [Aeromicrobium sp. CTD01-1L150]|uniref:glycoside hydrolase family 13 protein n=1 Tax=Aeromicrobium sp. CTD01-1L150 TaxID=3341830 RepID=UPI0035BEF63C